MADMNTMIADITAALASDSTIDTWSNANYGQGAAVLENCDPRDDPEAADCPLIIMFPAAKAGGLTQNNKSHVFGISCVVFDTEKPESAQGVIRFAGGRMVEELRGYVVEVIKDNVASDIHIENIVTEYNTIEQFPYISANMELTLTQEKLIGTDPFE